MRPVAYSVFVLLVILTAILPQPPVLDSPPPAPVAERGTEGDYGPEAVREFFTRWFGDLGYPMSWDDQIDLRDAWGRLAGEPRDPGRRLLGWQFVGPRAISTTFAYANQGWANGRVNWFEDLPGNTRYRIAAPSGGLWEVWDDPGNPIPLSDTIDAPFGQVCGSFGTDPFDDDTILMGSGAQGHDFGSGLWKTVDRGLSWSSIPVAGFGSLEPNVYYRVRFDPNNSLRVHLATDTGLWLSTDGGNSFSQVRPGKCTEVVFVPWDPQVVYSVHATGADSSGIYRSDDGGDSYVWLQNGGAPTGDVGRTSLAVTPSTAPQVTAIYASVDAKSGPKVYRSDDDGATWVDRTPADTTWMVQGWYNNTIAVDPFIPEYIVMGWVRLYWSNDAGQTWRIAGGLHSDFHTLGFEGSKLYAGNDAGLQNGNIPSMISTDFNWLTPTWFPIAQVYESDISPLNPEWGIYGMQDNGIATTHQLLGDGGIVHWRRGGDAGSVAINPTNGPWYAVDVGDTITGPLTFWNYTGNNQGDDWVSASAGLGPSNKFIRHVRSPRVPAPGHRIVTYSDSTIYGSTDDGATWTVLTPTPIDGDVEDISIADTMGENVWAVTGKSNTDFFDRIRYRKNDGTWAERSQDLPNFLRCMRVVPADPFGNRPQDGYALMGAGAATTPAAGNRIFYTSDAGITWPENLTGDMPAQLPIFDLVENPTDPDILYVATAAGVMRTENRGMNWVKWNLNLPGGLYVTRLQIVHPEPGLGELYATSFGRGVWRRDITYDLIPSTDVPVVEPTDLSFRLQQNPAVGDARFSYRLGEPGTVQLDVFDVRGRRVDRVVATGQEGENFVAWDGTDREGAPAASGVYFAILEAGTQRAQARFVLVR